MNPLHQPPTGRVSFAAYANVRLHDHVASYTEEEMDATYYSQKEFVEMRKQMSLEVEMLEDDIFAECDNYCTRGLECRRKTSVRKRNRTRRQARHCVISAQIQGEGPVRLADAYRKVSSRAKRDAIILGSLDARAAEDIAEQSSEQIEAYTAKHLVSPTQEGKEQHNIMQIGSPFRRALSSAAA